MTSGANQYDPLVDPLMIAVVTVRSGGTIGMTHCPGRNQVDALGRRWSRDLVSDLAAIEAWGARALVSLIELPECAALGVPDLATSVARTALAWHHMPIPDMQRPGQAFANAWARSGDQLIDTLNQGEKIVLHCAGGLGRTGTLAAKLLAEFGTAPEDAITVVRRVRPGAIESVQQERYVLAGTALAGNGV